MGEGDLFQALEAPPPGKILVYFYRPPGEKAALKEVGVGPGGGKILPGGYSQAVLEPGDLHFSAWLHWVVSSRADVGMDLGALDLEARAGETYFIRIEEKPRLFLLPGVELQRVEARAALPEIRKCRRMVEQWPLSEPAEDPIDAAPAPGS